MGACFAQLGPSVEMKIPTAEDLFVAPHTTNSWGHVEFVQKTRGLGSGNWCKAGISEVGCPSCHLGTSFLPA